jgi:D-glycero-alpha-D-manno-heptose 1-phosphate guanylyltransferase
LFHIISFVNFDQYIFALGFRSELVIDYLNENFSDLDLIYSVERNPLGTGGAIKEALKHTSKGEVVALNGDSFFNIDYNHFFEFHGTKKSKFSIALAEIKDNDRYGGVELSDDVITSFKEKQSGSDNVKTTLINSGIYLIDSAYFLALSMPESFSIEKDFFENNDKSIQIHGKVFRNKFIDIGVPNDYHAFPEFIKNIDS